MKKIKIKKKANNVLEKGKKKASKLIENGKNKVKKGNGKVKSRLLIILMTLGIFALILVLVFSLYIIFTAPDFNTTRLYSKEASVLYFADGSEMARIGNENRVLTTYNDLPQVFIDALVATEDSRFFQHNGFDAARFLKASVKQAFGQSDAGGASTLTMQVAKNTYNGSDVSIIRKFKDIYMAVFKIEKSYTKEEIIEFYVNSQQLGTGSTNYTGIYGVEQASQEYFGKSVSDLSLPEASLLAGMFQAPSLYNPTKNPEKAKKRQNTVLTLMVRHGYITEEEAKNAADIPIESLLKSETKVQETSNPYQAVIDFVIDDVKEKTNQDPREVPMAIYTTIEKSVQDVINDLENGNLYSFANDKIQNGIAVTSTKDGSITALGPGRNYLARGINRADERRNPGSTAKIIVDYGPLIEYNNASTGTFFFDEPYTYSNGTSMKNYDGKHKGIISLRDALVDSRNIPALQAFQQTTEEQKINFIHSLGIDYGDNLYESASIGAFQSNGISPLESSAAYGAFARGGYYIEPYSFTKIVYLDDEKEVPYKYTKTRVMSEETAYMITNVLMEAVDNNVAGKINVSGTDVAGKSGTTTISEAEAKSVGVPSYTTPDHWVNVYSPDYSISLWYGYDNLKQGYLTSSTGGGPRRAIISTVANKILKPNSKFNKPSSVVEATIEFGTVPLELASSNTPDSLKRTELFKQGTEPTTVSNRFDTLKAPTNGNSLINGSSITLTWDAIATPDAIDTNKLQAYFNENYKSWAEKYYQERLAYNASNIGSIGYQVYLENSNGELISLGYTTQTSYNYIANEAKNYKFIIKSAYSIFKTNMSEGLVINANLANNTTTDTTLKTLVPSKGTLSPTFTPSTTNYNLEVEENVDSITFEAKTNSSSSKIASGLTCALKEDITTCKIIVTSDDNKTSKTYTINVKKKK